ncbi:unannotated protein [freshwater metagenome]|uniref:Unannotated protein n=1 Tax=freshwater metagenome TaxID=449393 RepID=A0A6J6XE43_9ZZZZ
MMFQPPSTQSDAEILTNKTVSVGIAARIALVVSNKNRIRFSKDPPYSSLRSFESGE